MRATNNTGAMSSLRLNYLEKECTKLREEKSQWEVERNALHGQIRLLEWLRISQIEDKKECMKRIVTLEKDIKYRREGVNIGQEANDGQGTPRLYEFPHDRYGSVARRGNSVKHEDGSFKETKERQDQLYEHYDSTNNKPVTAQIKSLRVVILRVGLLSPSAKIRDRFYYPCLAKSVYDQGNIYYVLFTEEEVATLKVEPRRFLEFVNVDVKNKGHFLVSKDTTKVFKEISLEKDTEIRSLLTGRSLKKFENQFGFMTIEEACDGQQGNPSFFLKGKVVKEVMETTSAGNNVKTRSVIASNGTTLLHVADDGENEPVKLEIGKDYDFLIQMEVEVENNRDETMRNEE